MQERSQGAEYDACFVRHSLLLTYKCFICLHFNYAAPIVYPAYSATSIERLQKVQNAAARLVVGGRKRDPISKVSKELHWLKIESRIMFKIMLLTYKRIKGHCSENLKIAYKTYNCRPQDYLLLETKKVNTNYGKRTFEYAAPRLWNALPLEVRMEEDIDKFKQQIKRIL